MSAELAGPTFADLQRELPRSSPRYWRYAALGAGSRAGALLSDGLRVGHRHGFDSGPFMAHVYADRAGGRTPLGRALDRRLLDRPTCRAFREIRALAERAVLEAIDAHPSDAPVVADLAAGPSPYLLRALQQRPAATAVLADVDPVALQGAAAAAEALGVADRTVLRRASAFDRAALAALDPRPDIVCELGLYGIYHDDELVRRHFADLGQLVAPEQLVCNVQVDNPEIERIARTWRNAAGERCVWRLRPVELIVAWARAAQLAPASIAADSHGIYRVLRLVRSTPEAPA